MQKLKEIWALNADIRATAYILMLVAFFVFLFL